MVKRCCLSSPQQNGGGSEQAGAACACGDQEPLSDGVRQREPARFKERTSLYQGKGVIFEKKVFFLGKLAELGVAAIRGDLSEIQTGLHVTFYCTERNPCLF